MPQDTTQINRLLGWGGGRNRWFVEFDDFCGINTPLWHKYPYHDWLQDSKWHHWTQSWKEMLRINLHRLADGRELWCTWLLKDCQDSVFPCFCNHKLRFVLSMGCLDVQGEPVFNNIADPWRFPLLPLWTFKTSTQKPQVSLWPLESLAMIGNC